LFMIVRVTALSVAKSCGLLTNTCRVPESVTRSR
jgi:hypothetical protein